LVDLIKTIFENQILGSSLVVNGNEDVLVLKQDNSLSKGYKPIDPTRSVMVTIHENIHLILS